MPDSVLEPYEIEPMISFLGEVKTELSLDLDPKGVYKLFLKRGIKHHGIKSILDRSYPHLNGWTTANINRSTGRWLGDGETRPYAEFVRRANRTETRSNDIKFDTSGLGPEAIEASDLKGYRSKYSSGKSTKRISSFAFSSFFSCDHFNNFGTRTIFSFTIICGIKPICCMT